MHPIGKIIILVCLLIVASALIFKDSKNEGLRNLAETTPVPSIIPPKEDLLSGIEGLLSQNSKAPNVDLQGPWRCELKQEKSQASLYIFNKQIKASIKTGTETTTLLVKDDKIYNFSSNIKTGSMVKGVNQYFDLFETFSSFLPDASIFSVVENFLPKDKLSENFTKNLLNECKKQEIDEAIFKLPVGISFNEVTLDKLIQSGSQNLPDVDK